MKNFILVLALLLAHRSFANTDLTLIPTYMAPRFGDDIKVLELTAARLRVTVLSKGSSLRKKVCYKEYIKRPGLAPKVTPFEISQNLNVELESGKKLSLKNLVETMERNTDVLKSFLKLGCLTKNQVSLLIKGKLENNKKFKSQIYLKIKSDKILIGLDNRATVPFGGEVEVSVVPYMTTSSDDFESYWERMSPTLDQPVRNY